MLQDGLTRRDVAEAFGVSLSVVSRLWRRFQTRVQTVDVPDKVVYDVPHLDRTAISDRWQCVVVRILPEHRKMDFRQATGVRISDETVRNRLHEDNMNSRRPAGCPILSRVHCRDRLQFAPEHQEWQFRHWRPIRSQTSPYPYRFHISTYDCRVRVWRRQGERYADCTIIEHDRYIGGSVMV